MRDAGECQLSQLIDVLWGDEIKAETVVAIGEPHRQIVNVAKKTKADLILLGSHGAMGAWGLFCRNTTSRVVRNAPCPVLDRKSTRLNSSHRCISYAVFCLKKKTT